MALRPLVVDSFLHPLRSTLWTCADTPKIQYQKEVDVRVRSYGETRVRGWIRKDTRIGPFLNLYICSKSERCSIEVQVPSLFQDNTVSWVRIVNGFDKYVTESMPPAKEEDIASGKPIVKGRPRQKRTVTLT